jgi:uncharacterized cupin superfamily protein
MIKGIRTAFVNRSSLLKISGFVSWSALMLIIGVVGQDQIGITKAYADAHAVNIPPILRLDRLRLGGENLGDFAPYEPGRGNLIARGYDYYYSEDESFGIGVWESKPGQMTYNDLQYDELMLVLDGSLVMTSADGEREVFGVGEGLVLPRGWSGRLAVPEGGVRKIWVSYMGGVKGQ